MSQSIMNQVVKLQPPSEHYSDDVLYGIRRDATKQLELNKLMNESECIVVGIGTFVDNSSQWNVKQLCGLDRRLKAMLTELNIVHAFPLQRLCWPQMQLAKFPFLCISPQSSGKTYSYLLYIVSRCITKIPIALTDEIITPTTRFEINPDDCIIHPKYIIICSSQQQVELVDQQIDQIKLAAFGRKVESMNRQNIPPIVRTVSVHHNEEKLALRCNDSEILIATSAAILKCIKLSYITFTKCEQVIFDDLDITLQLHNITVRELIKRYLIDTQFNESDQENNHAKKVCQVFMFSRKWTLLVQQFVTSVFLQRTLIFGSIIEASVYANVRYELEFSKDIASKLNKLSDLLYLYTSQSSTDKKVAIMCTTNNDASRLGTALVKRGHSAVFLDEEDPMKFLQPTSAYSMRTASPTIQVMCDSTLEQVIDLLTDISHVIHFSLPEDLLVFDQRFRLMSKHIKNGSKDLVSTVFLNDKISVKHAKELYDVISRSSTTHNSTRLQLRDFISDRSNSLCWRWASTGVCRLEKLSKEDKFGSYCSAKHSLSIAENGSESELPKSGQFKITITHLVSPNEFYFRFEAHRDKSAIDKKWTKIEGTGYDFMKEFQSKLDEFKDTRKYSVPMEKIKKGVVYGIYSPGEARVDRIVLLEEFKKDINNGEKAKKNGMLDAIRYQLEYSKQCEAWKLDYGITINVYLFNIFELPDSLASVKPRCHRGFHLGVKPTDGEPNWLYKAKKFFYDQVCVNNLHDITVWLRLNSNNCFWFENMIVRQRLSNIDAHRVFKSEPHKELIKAGFADSISSEPSCLNRSERLETLSIWQVNECTDYIQYAFLRKDKDDLEIFVLHVSDSDLSLTVRNHDYNKQLIELEDRILEDYKNSQLQPLNYFAEGTYCIAKITMPQGDYFCNRCKIISASSWSEGSTVRETQFAVECLDHGDQSYVKRCDLFLASPDYFAQLPFQAILHKKLANLNLELLKDRSLYNKAMDAIYSFSRDEAERLVPLKCQLNEEGQIFIYTPVKGGHVAIDVYLEKEIGVKLFV